MAAEMIGVDPHKGSHTAVAIGADEMPLGRVRVRVRVRASAGRRAAAGMGAVLAVVRFQAEFAA